MIDSNVSSVSGSYGYNPQITNKVAAANSTNLANNAANQSAFSSYIGQALAQIGVANPTNSSAPVVSGANRSNASEKSLSSFIQDLFAILSEKNTPQNSTPTSKLQVNSQQAFLQGNENTEDSRNSDSASLNETAIAAYTISNSTTVGNLATNLQTLVKQLNEQSRNTANNSLSTIQSLKDGFKNILEAHGANSDDNATLGKFLQTLAQNLQGQSPLGIIISTQA